MRRKKSLPDGAPRTSGKPESPDESAKSGGINEGRRKLISRIGLGATLLAMGGQAYAMFRSLCRTSSMKTRNGSKLELSINSAKGRSLSRKSVFSFFARKTRFTVSRRSVLILVAP